MAKGPRIHASKHYPERLSFLTKEGDPKSPAEFSQAAENLLIKLVQAQAWQLLRARLKKRALESKIEGLRKKILDEWPDQGLHGVVVRAPTRAVQLILSRRKLRTIEDNGAFLAYLGEHAPEVVEAIRLPVAAVIKNADDYASFIEIIKVRFGDDSVAGLELVINSDALHDLTSSGILEETDEFFDEEDGPIHVLVKQV